MFSFCVYVLDFPGCTVLQLVIKQKSALWLWCCFEPQRGYCSWSIACWLMVPMLLYTKVLLRSMARANIQESFWLSPWKSEHIWAKIMFHSHSTFQISSSERMFISLEFFLDYWPIRESQIQTKILVSRIGFWIVFWLVFLFYTDFSLCPFWPWVDNPKTNSQGW